MNSHQAGPTLEEIKSLIQESRREILAALPRAESPKWKLFVIVLPIILTSLLGLAVFFVQNRITKKVDLESKSVQARISLTQDYYRRRLEVYQGIHEALVALKEKAIPGQSLAATGFEDSINTFNHSYATNSLFLTPRLLTRLGDVWMVAVKSVREDPITNAALDDIAANTDLVEAQMRHDLLIDALDDDALTGTSSSSTSKARSSN